MTEHRCACGAIGNSRWNDEYVCSECHEMLASQYAEFDHDRLSCAGVLGLIAFGMLSIIVLAVGAWY